MRDNETASDQALIDSTRTGDSAAFAVLWSRHSGPALTVARSFTSLDADDVVAEAFSRIYAIIQNGGGPTAGFRPYLFTTVRNVAARWGRTNHTINLDDVDSLEDPSSTESEVFEALDRTSTAQAFRSLPSRWQEVLWYIDVEGMAPRQVSALLGMKPNSISALAIRAREGLRQAWIKTHLASTSTDPECTRTIERLPAYARGTLGARPTHQVQDHLTTCAHCQIAAEEANHISSRLALILLPLTAGVAGATAYAASLHLVGAAAATAAVTFPTLTGSGSSTLGAGVPAPGPGAGTTAIAGLVGAGTLVILGVGVSVALLLGPISTSTDVPQVDTGTTEQAAEPDTSHPAAPAPSPAPHTTLPPTPEPSPTGADTLSSPGFGGGSVRPVPSV